MNEINSKIEDFDFRYIHYPKIDGSCLVISSDLIKFGVNIHLCLIYIKSIRITKLYIKLLNILIF